MTKHASINLLLDHAVDPVEIKAQLNVKSYEIDRVIKKRTKRNNIQKNLKLPGAYIDGTVQSAIRLFSSLDPDSDADVLNRIWERHIHNAIHKMSYIIMITEPYGRTAMSKHGDAVVLSTCVQLVWMKLHQFDPARGTNPFSWLNIVLRNECKRMAAMDRAGMRTNVRMRSAFFRLDDVFDVETSTPVNKDDLVHLSYTDDDDSESLVAARLDEFVQFLKERGKTRDADFITLSLRLSQDIEVGKRFPSNQLLPRLGKRLDLSRQGLYNSRKRLKKLWKEFVDISDEV